MASKNTRKVLNKIYTKNKNFHPDQNPISWHKAVTLLKNKEARMTYNMEFVPLYEQFKIELLEEGYRGKELKQEAKDRAKAVLKANRPSIVTAEQDPKESQTLLPEG